MTLDRHQLTQFLVEACLADHGFSYENRVSGDIVDFEGSERIERADVEIYSLRYGVGLIA